MDLLDVVVPLTFLEELSEAHTTSGCERIFNYIEKRKSRITVVNMAAESHETTQASHTHLVLGYGARQRKGPHPVENVQ